MELLDDSLERSWWNAKPQHLSRLPNLLGFQKVSHQAKAGRVNSSNQDGHKVNAHAAGSPDTAIIQIGSVQLTLHAKWLPLLMFLSLMQVVAFQSWKNNERLPGPPDLNALKIVWIYHNTFCRFAQDALAHMTAHPGQIPIDQDWMPFAMHRFLVRTKHAKSHDLKFWNQELKRLYESDLSEHFYHGKCYCSHLYVIPLHNFSRLAWHHP
jgi:hypothetical protein